MKKFNILLLVAWLIVIFMFSNEKADVSSERSDAIAYNIVDIMENITGKDYTDTDLESILHNVVFIIRKTAHFMEYLILGILVINVIKDYKLLDTKYVITGVLLCMLYSISDEVHQLFIQGRSCQLRDVLIDTSGSIVGILIYYLIYKYKRNKIKN